MVWIPARTFEMGSDDFYPEERPAHQVTVDGFWIDRYPVTNERFSDFVDRTGHVTRAERPLDPAAFPGADPEALVPGGLVFERSAGPVDLTDWTNWWAYVPGAQWRHPRGPGSGLENRPDHPVVQVAFEDAEAFATDAGAALPTEAEWELAARGGLTGAAFTWGDTHELDGRPMANTWQGRFPWENLLLDGFEETSPVGSFPSNGYGLHDMAGNVWEWTTDWWSDNHPSPRSPCCPEINPRGGAAESSHHPRDPFPRRVIKGGSHLCAPNYCLRYRPAARQPEDIDTATCHLGFRCIVRPDA